MGWVRCCGSSSKKVAPIPIYQAPDVVAGAFTYTATNSYYVANLSDGYHIDSTGNSPSTVQLWNTTDFATGGNKYLTLTYTRTGSGTLCNLVFGSKSIDIPVSSSSNTIKLDVSDLPDDAAYRITINNNTGNSQSSFLFMTFLGFTNS